MKKFHDSVVSWYQQWAILLTSAIIMASAGLSFTIYATFDWQSWVLCIATGISTVCSSTIRFKSLKLAPASALQKLIPLMTLFQWVFDVALFHVYYTPL